MRQDWLLAAALLLAACSTGSETPSPAPQTPAAPSRPSAPPSTPAAVATPGTSTPVEDGVYPEVGDPGVDALRYRLDLDWDPASPVLTGWRPC